MAAPRTMEQMASSPPLKAYWISGSPKTILRLSMNRCATLLLCLLVSTGSLFAQSYSVTTVAGPGFPVNGSLATTQAIDFPYAVISDGAGGFYISSYAPSRIYRVSAAGTLTIVAGTGLPG